MNQRPLGPQPPAPTCRAVAELLESKGSDGKAKNGFFLQVEGASIDKRDHAADPCGQIGETLAFDRTVKVALYYQAQHPTRSWSWSATTHTKPLGLSSALQTKDGSPIRVAYGTAAAGASQQHTGSEVRIAAKGPQATNVLGITEETDTFDTLLGRH